MNPSIDRSRYVGVVGLGVMGGAIARRLLGAGFAVVGCDPDAGRRAELADAGGHAARDAAEVAAAADVIVVSLPNAQSLADTVDAFAGALRAGAVVVETSTLPVAAKRGAHDGVVSLGGEFIDAPVSGTGRQAAAGDLVVMASGAAGCVERCRPVFEAFARDVCYVGEFPNGTLYKYVANLLVAVHTVAAAEAHALAAAAGLDPDLVQRVIGSGVGSSRMWEIRGPMMITGDYEPPAARLDLLVKDVGLISAHARACGLDTPLLDAARRVFELAAAAGHGAQDAAAVRRVLGGGDAPTPDAGSPAPVRPD